MTHTPALSELAHLTHLARDSARFVAVLRQTPPGTRVPTCPDWDADDLLWHLAAVSADGGAAAATIGGSAADLDCWLWHRPPVGQVERAGDPTVLARLDQTIAAGIS